MAIEKRIARILAEKEDGVFMGIAETVPFDVYAKPNLSGRHIKIGDYVPCVMIKHSENNKFYLEESTEPLSNPEIFKEQENLYLPY